MPQQNTYTTGGVYLNTPGATPAVAAYFETRDNALYEVEVRINAIRTDTFATGVSYWRRAMFVNDAGVLTQIGSTQSIGTDIEGSGLSGADVAVAASAENINVTVTGVADIPLSWNVNMSVVQAGQWAANGGLLTPQ